MLFPLLQKYALFLYIAKYIHMNIIDFPFIGFFLLSLFRHPLWHGDCVGDSTCNGYFDTLDGALKRKNWLFLLHFVVLFFDGTKMKTYK